MSMGRSSANHQNCGTFTHAYCYSHLSCIRQITRKLSRVCQPLDSQVLHYWTGTQTGLSMFLCNYAMFCCWKTAKVAKRLGLRPRPRWGSLQRSPVPPSWARGGYAPSCSHPPLLISSTLSLSRTPPSPDQPTGLHTYPTRLFQAHSTLDNKTYALKYWNDYIIKHDLNKDFVSSSCIRTALVVPPFKSHFSVHIPFFYPSCELQGTTLYRLLAIALATRVPRLDILHKDRNTRLPPIFRDENKTWINGGERRLPWKPNN